MLSIPKGVPYLRKNIILIGMPLLVVAAFFSLNQKEPSNPLAGKDLTQNLPNSKKAKRPDKPAEAAAYWNALHEAAGDENPAVLNRKAADFAAQDRAKRKNSQLLPLSFDVIGPGNFAGRVRGLVVKPSNPDILLTGSVSGGIWKTTNGGNVWTPVFNFEPTLAIGHLLVDPDNENRVFAGTGEGFQNGGAMRGLGIYVSEDFGDSWQQLSSTATEDFYYVNRLARIPGSNVLLAATGRGLFRSEDLGQTWQDVDGINFVTARGFVDLKVNPANSDIVMASYYGQIISGDDSRNYLMRSADGGKTWTRLRTESGLPNISISRHELGFGTDGTLYVAIGDNTNAVGTNGLYKSTDGGLTYTKSPSSTEFIERQGWYDLVVGVDPSDSNRVYMGAIDIYRSTDGGTTITKQSRWFPAQGEIPLYVHADLHVITFHPTDPKTFFIGCDGGVFKTTDGGDTFRSINGNLSVTQFYGMAVHPNGEVAIGGTQDNGTIFYFSDDLTWLEWIGGDGGFCAWDQQDPNYIYGSTPNANMFGSGAGITSATGLSLPSTSGAPFIQPFTLDPNDGNRMMVGTNTIFFSKDVRKLGDAAWETTPTTFGRSIRSTTISPHDGKIGFAGDASGTIFRTTDLGGSNEYEKILDRDFGSGDITWVEVDPNDTSSQTIYATLGDYDANRIVMTQDGGMTWRSLQGNLPEIPAFCVRVDPQNPKRLFLGTELGLWTTADVTQAAPVWERYDYGTAYTRILQLHWAKQGEILWIGTYGRGMIVASRNPVEVRFAREMEQQGDGDGILDIGERQKLTVTLANQTNLPIETLKASLSATDPRLEVLSANSLTTTIAENGTATLVFDIGLDDWSANAGKGLFNLNLELGSNTFSHPYEIDVAANPKPRTDAFEDGAEGSSLFTTQARIGDSQWAMVETNPRSGTRAWFSANISSYADNSLISPWFEVTEANAAFSFWISYDLEGNATQRWDGAVLELRTQDGKWTDVGQKTGVPYDGQLFNNTSLQFRHAWSGNQVDYRQGNLPLGDYQGQKVQLRFLLACDTGTANRGIWIDDLQATGVTWQDTLESDLTACSSCNAKKGSVKDFQYILAEANQNGAQKTVVGIINPQSSSQMVDIVGFSSAGAVRGFVNTEIPGNGKIWSDLAALFPQQHTQIQWVQVGADQALEVFGELQRPGVRSAYAASSNVSDFAYIPHVGKNTGLFQTYISAVNGLEASSTTQITASSNRQATFADPHQDYAKAFNTAVDLFGTDLSDVDWARLNSTQSNLAAMEYFSRLPGETQIASLGLDQNRGKLLRFLHIAKDINNFWTGIVYFNISDASAQVTETYFDELGNVLEARDVSLNPSAKITRLFDSSTVGVSLPSGAAWMEVTSDQDLIGYELFGAPTTSSADYFVGLQGEYSSGSQLLYPHVESSDNLFTGIVALNLGDQAADLTFNLYANDGSLLESSTQTGLASKTKATLLARQLFSAEALARGSWIQATSTGSQWAGFLLWGDLTASGRQNLAGIKASPQ